MRTVHACVPALWLYLACGARVDFGDVESLGEGARGQRSNTTICAAVSQETLQTHRRCLASLRTPSVLQRFPNLEEEWCDERLRDITRHQCESEERDRLRQAAMIEVGFRRITALVGASEEKLMAEGAWEACSSRHHSCMECESRYAGAREHTATTHACEWRAGACVKSSRLQPRPWGEAASVCGQDPAAESFLEVSGRAGSNVTGVGKKIALLVGITYEGEAKLPGTYSDIKGAFKLLTREKGFHPSSIYVLYDKGNPSDFQHQGHQAQILPANGQWDGKPTSFWEMVHWILPANRVGPGDFFLFWFAGHGSQMGTSRNKNELDGKDECLVTPTLAPIMDDDFYNFLLTIPMGASVTAIVDACHSEGFSDLPFNYRAGSVSAGLLPTMLKSFEAAREWCTDWAYALRELPRARITYISGAQNEQESEEQSHGGAFTTYALRYWNEMNNERAAHVSVRRSVAAALGMGEAHNGGGGWERGTESSLFNRFKALLKYFRKWGTDQEPNVCMWPSMSDQLDFNPFSPPPDVFGTPGYLVDYHPFVGGQWPGHVHMAVPPICTNGDRARAGSVTPQTKSQHHLDVKEEFKYAGELYKQGGHWEGWEIADFTLSLLPANEGHGIWLQGVAEDVVSYVAPGGAGARAGVRIGDVIRYVNGVPFSQINPIEKKHQVLMAGGELKVVGTRT